MKAKRLRFDIYEDSKGEFRWRAKHQNGKILADSGEGYTRRHRATTAAIRFAVLCKLLIEDLAPKASVKLKRPRSKPRHR